MAQLKKEGAEKDAQIRKLVASAMASGTSEDDLAEILGDLNISLGGSDDEEDDDVSTELLMWFFKDAIEELKKPEFKAKIDAKTADMPLAGPDVDEEVTKERYARVRDEIDALYVEIWEKYNVDQSRASKAVMHAGFRLTSDDLSEEEKEMLSTLIEKFTRIEDDVEGTAMLGREAWIKRKVQEAKFERVQQEVINKFTSLKGAAAQQYAMELQQEGMKLQQKLQSMDPQAAAAYLENPSDEDQDCIMRFQAFQSLVEKMSGGSHGHSHGGKPCHGHGEPAQQQQQAHSHSHGGSHGHSHGGKPCHGHGH